MNAGIIIRTLLLSLSLVAVNGGCSRARLQRFAYDVGTQRSCLKANEHRYNESMRDLQCLTPGSEKNREYEQYQRAREEEFKN